MTDDSPHQTSKTVSTLPPDEVTERFSAPEPAPRPRPRRRADRSTWFGDPPRRPLAAGHVVLITMAALLLGALLNARGLHKTAQIQSPGWQRDIALDVTGGLEAVSGWVLLDRPREWLQDASGRSGDDDIDTAIFIPTPKVTQPPPSSGGKGPTKPASGPPPKTAYSPQHKLRVWTAGDSLAIVPGLSLDQLVSSAPQIKVMGVDGQVATGLERPDVYNWFTRIRQEMASSTHPDAVVLAFGGNDDHSYMTGGPPDFDASSSFQSKDWVKEYRRRVGGVMDTIIQKGGVVFWIGLPITSDGGRNERYQFINRIVSYEVNERPGKAFMIDTYDLFTGPNGGYADYLPDAGGQLELMRQSDGIHFTPAGGELVAKQVVKAFHKAFDLTSWREARQRAKANGGSGNGGSTGGN
jgi:hypothetical protein